MFIAATFTLIYLTLLPMMICIPLIYWFAYNRHVKRLMEHPEPGGKPWPSPGKVLVVELLVLAVGAMVVFVANLTYTTFQISDSWEGQETPVEVATYESGELSGTWLEQYTAGTAGELPGYTLREYDAERWHYLFYEAEEPDSMHPAFLLYTIYVGEEDYAGCVCETALGDAGMRDSSAFCGEVPDYYLTVGNERSAACEALELRTALYTDAEAMTADFFAEDAMDFADQTAHAAASASLRIPLHE